MSDQAYLDFLNKANEPMPTANQSAAANTSSSTGLGLKLVDAGEAIPKALAKAKDVFYVSDADEPFEPVVLKWDETGNKGLPDDGE